MDPSKDFSLISIDMPRAVISQSLQSPAENPLLSSIKGKMETFCSSTIIFKVPDEMISIDDTDDVFVPTKVSIGPFHHGRSHLESMEVQKWRYLCAFLKRKPSVCLQKLVDVIVNAESRVRKCYEVKFELDSHKFAQMMLIDCCFVLELLSRCSTKNLRRRNDPIFTTPGLLFDLRCDMILLENQIPLFLLKDVFNCVQDPVQENISLNELAFRFFRTMVGGERQFVYDNFMQDADHLLDMVHSCFLSTYPRVETKNRKEKSNDLPRASNLQSAGFKFKDAKAPKSVLDIKFQNGVLEIPPLKVYERTEAILRNLIAYELCQVGNARQVDSYVNFMSHLLQSDEDAKLLYGRKILLDLEDDETQVIRNMKWISQHKSSLSDTYFAGIAQNLNDRPNRCVEWLRKMRRNPVAIGVAAIWLVIVIFVAAFFSALIFLQRRYNYK